MDSPLRDMKKNICYCGHPEGRHQGSILKPCLHCTCKDFFTDYTVTEAAAMEKALKEAVRELNDNCLTDDQPTTPEKKCCGHKKWTLSKSTKRGTRKICNNCGKDWKNEWETPKLLPTSSYEVTCGRCEKSIKHSC